jgi:AcrR family transcriptional regulator
MNEKFYSLPDEKRQRIINAGFHVFSQNSYKKSPVSEIADAANISKSLLFYYFKDKRELYLFLWDEAVRISKESLGPLYNANVKDFFELMRMGMNEKLRLMRKYPDLTGFIIKAFYEKDSEIAKDIHSRCDSLVDESNLKIIKKLNPEDYIEGLDLNMMYSEMYWAGDGYIRSMLEAGNLDVDTMERGFTRLLDFWKSVYLRK